MLPRPPLITRDALDAWSDAYELLAGVMLAADSTEEQATAA